MTTTINTTGAAINLYRALLTAAEQAPEERQGWNSCLTFRHNRTMLKLAHTAKRLRQFAADMLKSWGIWGGGPKPEVEKKVRSVWPSRKLSVLKACWEDGDLASVRRIADELGGFVALMQHRSGGTLPLLMVAPDPVAGWEEFGVVVAYSPEGKCWSVTHAQSGLKCADAARGRAKALENFEKELSIKGADVMKKALEAAPVLSFSLADWDSQHGIETCKALPQAEEIEAEEAQAVAVPEAQAVAEVATAAEVAEVAEPEAAPVAPAAALVTAVDSLNNPGTPDTKNSEALPELDGFKSGDVVDVTGRTIGRSTIELVYRRKLAGFDAVPMARIVGASGKRLDVLLYELTRVEAPAAPAEVQAPPVAALEEVSPPCDDIAPAVQEVEESKAADIPAIDYSTILTPEAPEVAAAPAEPAKAPASPEFVTLMAQARQARQMAREAIARAKASSAQAVCISSTPKATQPTQAQPAPAVRFMAHYVTDGKNKAKVRYYASQDRSGRAFVDVNAKHYGAQLGRMLPGVRNDTDTMTDYFCKDSVRIYGDSPLYPAALARVNANEAARDARRAKRSTA